MVRSASCVTIANPKVMTKVLGIVYRIIATHQTHKAGFIAAASAVTLSAGVCWNAIPATGLYTRPSALFFIFQFRYYHNPGMWGYITTDPVWYDRVFYRSRIRTIVPGDSGGETGDYVYRSGENTDEVMILKPDRAFNGLLKIQGRNFAMTSSF